MRLYVKISDMMGEKLDKYANDFGMSKSAFVAYALGKHINQLDHESQVYDSVSDIMQDFADAMSEKGKSRTYVEELSTNEYTNENTN